MLTVGGNPTYHITPCTRGHTHKHPSINLQAYTQRLKEEEGEVGRRIKSEEKGKEEKNLKACYNGNTGSTHGTAKCNDGPDESGF